MAGRRKKAVEYYRKHGERPLVGWGIHKEIRRLADVITRLHKEMAQPNVVIYREPDQDQ